MNLTQAGKSVNRQILTHLSHKKVQISSINISHLRVSQNQNVIIILCPSSLLVTKTRLPLVHFFLEACNVCPRAIPEYFAYNGGLQLLVKHPFV